MKESAAELKERNNRRDRLLSWENKECMTEIICYLREKSVEAQRVEDIRQDITDMLLEAQDRGEDARSVIGEDYRIFCDEILDSVRDWEEELRTKKNFSAYAAWLPWMGFFSSGLYAYSWWRQGEIWETGAWLETLVSLFLYTAIAFLIKVFTRKFLTVELTYFFKGKRVWLPVLTGGFFLCMQILWYSRC